MCSTHRPTHGPTHRHAANPSELTFMHVSITRNALSSPNSGKRPPSQEDRYSTNSPGLGPQPISRTNEGSLGRTRFLI